MDILEPNLSLFKKKYKLGQRQILFTSFAADVHTPVSSLIKLEKKIIFFYLNQLKKEAKKEDTQLSV